MSEFDRCQEAVGRFCAAHTKAELDAIAVEHDLLINAVRTTADLLSEPQLEAREYWREIEPAGLGRAVRTPGPFAKFSVTPLTIEGRAPAIGEQTAEVLGGELGLSAGEIEDLASRGVIGGRGAW